MATSDHLMHRLALARPEDPVIFQGEEQFRGIIRKAEANVWKEKPIGELVGLIGLELLGIPYVGGTLELSIDNEVCSANLLGLDCVTFYETVLGIARIIKQNKSEPEDLLNELTFMRYRNGQITDYTSRLHYVGEWYSDNEAKEVVEDITSTLPEATEYDKKINFMSTHSDAYKQLKSHPELVEEIETIENDLNTIERYYLPKAYIEETEKNLQTGDIIAITTSIKGLDVSHTGLCYRDEDGRLRFLHASLDQKKVVLDTDLHEYIAGKKKQTGIMVARPIEIDANQ